MKKIKKLIILNSAKNSKLGVNQKDIVSKNNRVVSAYIYGADRIISNKNHVVKAKIKIPKTDD